MTYFLPRPSAWMTTSPVMSQEVRKRALRSAEVPGAEQQGDRDDAETQGEPRQIELALATQQAPAEAIDHAHHRIKAIKHPPFFRDHGARKAHRRNIQAKLQNERDDIPEVTILYVERCDVESRTETRENCQQ